MMTNHPSSEDLFAYRDGELDREKRGLVEAHVLSCTSCRTKLEEMSDAEGMLRQDLADPDDSYFDALTESVLARVAPGGGRAAAAKTPAGPEPARAARRQERDDERPGRAPGLPWPAIISAVSAAAAVVVVTLLLFRTPAVWRGAPKPGVVGLDKEEAPPAPAKEAAPKESEPPAEPLASNAPAPAPAVGGSAAMKKDVAAGEARTPSAGEALLDAPKGAAAQKPSVAARANEEAPSAAGMMRAAPSGAGEESGFPALAARYGLPPLFDPDRVSSDALLRAEPEIRTLYVTGRSGADSARVRLYLAEAARVRSGDAPNADTYDAILRHYRRALQLAQDPATWRMAKKRLDDFVARVAPPR